MKQPVTADPWTALRALTPARIALGRAGESLPTDALIEFGVACAQARDAVHVALDVADLRGQLADLYRQRADLHPQRADSGEHALVVQSAVGDRAQFLRRPDLGRRLDPRSREALTSLASSPGAIPPPLVVVIADGLSATAAQRHAVPLLDAVRRRLSGAREGPVIIALQARVALGDEIGERLGAAQVAVLIGERPGLSSPDSLGVYFTHAPRVGRTDAERNCISNIRPGGLGYDDAAERLVRLLSGARQIGCSGLALKDHTDANATLRDA